jgi:hypothetical protein
MAKGMNSGRNSERKASMYLNSKAHSTGRPWSREVIRPLQALLLALLIWFLNSAVAYTPALATPSTPTSATSTGTTPGPAEPAIRTWQPGPVYTQIGSSCVAYSLAAWLDAQPNPVQNHPSGWDIYLAAREVDGITQPHDGTTIQAGIEVLSQLGYVRTWESTHDAGAALGFLRSHGPIVLETDFPQEQPVFDGEHNLVWTGKIGRHAWLCYGVDEQDRLSCQNSSGPHWNEAEGGRFHVTRAALTRLLANGLAWLINESQGAGSGTPGDSASNPAEETPLPATFDRATVLPRHNAPARIDEAPLLDAFDRATDLT